MFAVTGKLCKIDCNTKTAAVEEIPEQLYKQYLGGYGLGTALLLERMDPGCDPLGPENIIGLATGYLTGTGAFIASRFMAFGKSPSTKGWGDANCGGYFGSALKKAGVDVVLLTGSSEEPIYVVIEDGVPSVDKADWLWGKDCYETEDLLKEKHGKECEVACIGPAGEHLSLIAGISTDKGRFAARSALGAVMGSKKVKAVVCKGKQPIELAHPEEMKSLRKKYITAFKNPFGDGLSTYGTPMFYETALKSGDAPWKNWSSSVEEKKDFQTTAEKVVEYQVKKYACSGCPVACGGHVEVKEGEFKTDGPVHKVEYETMGLFGSNLLNDDVESLIKINDLCNRYGMDTISCGGLVAYAIECYERGYITPEQTDGLELGWGNVSAIIALVEKIGKAEGIGAVLAEGFDNAVAEFGEETAEYAMAVRGEGLPSHDPRWHKGLALTYFLDPTPARHTQGSTTFPVAGYEMPEIPPDEEKGRAVHHSENVHWAHVLNSAGLCLFGYAMLDFHSLPEFLHAADGREWTLEELRRMGKRLTVSRQLFNERAGWTIDQYDFPERVLGNPPLEDGPLEGVQIDLETVLHEYLDENGFDRKTGLPSLEVLEELGLDRFM